jgi:hypothetical protein
VAKAGRPIRTATRNMAIKERAIERKTSSQGA